LFVTKYSLNNDAYLTPEQMGMPFNSPANDYLMVIDEAKGVGWFVSDRNQPEGKVCVYLFIPDESRTHIPEGADDELLNHRARLNSIRDTWIDGQDYAGLIRLAQTGSASTGKAVAKDFDFVVNDTHLYNVWSDFRSPEARSFYEKAVGIKKKIDGMKSKLDEARSVYVTANDAMRKQLAPSILKAEDELATLLQQAGECDKKARNTENVALKNK
jgi:hypothetical protein